VGKLTKPFDAARPSIDTGATAVAITVATFTIATVAVAIAVAATTVAAITAVAVVVAHRGLRLRKGIKLLAPNTDRTPPFSTRAQAPPNATTIVVP